MKPQITIPPGRGGVTTFRRPWAAAIGSLAVCLLTWGPSAADAQTEIDRRVTAAADGEVRIENFAGSLVIRGWQKNEVAVSGTLGKDVDELRLDSRGREVRIEVKFDGRGRRNQLASHLEIQVPMGSDVDVETVSAEVTFDGVDGSLQTETVSGDVTIEGAPEGIEIETVSGQVDVLAATRRVTIESVSGDVQLVGVSGDVEVQTVSGDVEVRGEELSKLDVEMVSGDLDYYGTPGAGDEIEVAGHSGDIVLWLGAATAATFKVQTFSGNIENRLGPPARKSSRYTSERELKFTLGDGAADIDVETFSGTVAIRPREAGAI